MPRVANIQVRRDTAANWASTNPVLAAGEQGFETNTNRFKIGDGTTAWNSLQYQAIAKSSTPINVKGSFYSATNVIPLYTSPSGIDTYVDNFTITNMSGGVANARVFLTNRNIDSQVYSAVASGPTTTTTTSTDGITWTTRTMPASANWRSIAYGNNIFVAAAYGSTSAASSTDGITWTLRTMPANVNWNSITYGNGIFVAVSRSSTSAAVSTNGITWTTSTLTTSTTWESVSYGNGIFVVTSNNPVNISTDGFSWKAISTNAPLGRQVIYGNGYFVGLNSTSNIYYYSTNGVTWTLGFLQSPKLWTGGISYGNGTFLTVGAGSTDAATSTDAINWTLRTLPASATWINSFYGNGLFIAIAQGSTSAALSTDGITWTLRTLSASATWELVRSGHIQDNELIYKNNSIAANATINLDATDASPIRIPAGYSLICQASSTAVNFQISGERVSNS